jgi:hypothetical protein
VPGVEDLISMLDGVVVVGDATNPVPSAHVFAEVSSATRRTPPRAAVRSSSRAAPSGRRWVVPAIGVAAAAVIAVMLGRMYLTRPQPPVAAVLRRDSAAASDSLVSASPAIDSSPPLVVTNPADSTSASRFAVQIAMVDTEDGAALRVRAGGGDFPVGTYAPVSRGADRGTWYKVVTGAYVDRNKAEQLLGFLRQRGLVPRGWGTVIRAPFGLQIATAPSQAEAAPIIADFQSRNVPVYGLLQRDGSIRVYAGAFETPDEAAPFKSALKSTKNIDATLAYRVGRAY